MAGKMIGFCHTCEQFTRRMKSKNECLDCFDERIQRRDWRQPLNSYFDGSHSEKDASKLMNEWAKRALI